jgi:ABC-type antimicrobial peptide transport system permease subunit
VLRLIVRQGALLLTAGLAIGTVLAMAAGRVVSSLLFGLDPSDPRALLAGAAVLAAATLVATYIPATRAASLNPLDALRSE